MKISQPTSARKTWFDLIAWTLLLADRLFVVFYCTRGPLLRLRIWYGWCGQPEVISSKAQESTHDFFSWTIKKTGKEIPRQPLHCRRRAAKNLQGLESFGSASESLVPKQENQIQERPGTRKTGQNEETKGRTSHEALAARDKELWSRDKRTVLHRTRPQWAVCVVIRVNCPLKHLRDKQRC